MKKNKEITAAELMAQLQSDSEFVSHQDEQEKARKQREAKYRALAAPILDELNSMGVKASALGDLLRFYAPISAEITETLLHHLPAINDEVLQEQIVRVLGSSNEPFNGAGLVKLFESSQSQNLRWAIANTIAEARPLDITNWVIYAVSNPLYGQAREMLVLAVARLASADTAREVLAPLFDIFPGHIAAALAEFGDEREVQILRQKLDGYKGWQKKEINRAITHIQKRLKRTSSHIDAVP
jgi:hypothetical protein